MTGVVVRKWEAPIVATHIAGDAAFKSVAPDALERLFASYDYTARFCDEVLLEVDP